MRMRTTPCHKEGFVTEHSARNYLKSTRRRSRHSTYETASVYRCAARSCQNKPFHIGHNYDAKLMARDDRKRLKMYDDLEDVFAEQINRIVDTLRPKPVTADPGESWLAPSVLLESRR